MPKKFPPKNYVIGLYEEMRKEFKRAVRTGDYKRYRRLRDKGDDLIERMTGKKLSWRRR